MLTDLHRQALTTKTYAGFIKIGTVLVAVGTLAGRPLSHASHYLWNEDIGE